MYYARLIVKAYMDLTVFSAISDAFHKAKTKHVFYFFLSLLVFTLCFPIAMRGGDLWFLGFTYALGLLGYVIYYRKISVPDDHYLERKSEILREFVIQSKINISDIDREMLEKIVFLEINIRDIDGQRAKWIVALIAGLLVPVAFGIEILKYFSLLFVLLLSLSIIEKHFYYTRRGGKVNLIVSEVMKVVSSLKR